jgi:cyclic pyranopterin phosphate synthase
VSGKAPEPAAPGAGLTHFDAEGRAQMVDVGEKAETERVAIAGARVVMQPATLAAIMAGEIGKGDVLGVARLAGIQAGKRTGDLIPLCHVLPGASVAVTLEADASLPGVTVRAECWNGTSGNSARAMSIGAIEMSSSVRR